MRNLMKSIDLWEKTCVVKSCHSYSRLQRVTTCLMKMLTRTSQTFAWLQQQSLYSHWILPLQKRWGGDIRLCIWNQRSWCLCSLCSCIHSAIAFLFFLVNSGFMYLFSYFIEMYLASRINMANIHLAKYSDSTEIHFNWIDTVHDTSVQQSHNDAVRDYVDRVCQ